MCELFWASRLNEENYSQIIQVDIEDREAYEQATKNGAIWVTPHYGNFEWISLMMGYRHHPFTLVAQDFKNELLTKVFSQQFALRSLSGARWSNEDYNHSFILLLAISKEGLLISFMPEAILGFQKSFVTCHDQMRINFLHQIKGDAHTNQQTSSTVETGQLHIDVQPAGNQRWNNSNH